MSALSSEPLSLNPDSLTQCLVCLREMGETPLCKEMRLVAEKGSWQMLFWGTVSRKRLEAQAYGFNTGRLTSSEEQEEAAFQVSRVSTDPSPLTPSLLYRVRKLRPREGE